MKLNTPLGSYVILGIVATSTLFKMGNAFTTTTSSTTKTSSLLSGSFVRRREQYESISDHSHHGGQHSHHQLPLHSARSIGSRLLMAPQEAWDAYNVALEAHPLLVKSITASVILGAADLAGQALESRTAAANAPDGAAAATTTIDFARTARFAFFGLVLQAPWNHFYYLMLDGALPPTEEPFTPTTGIKVVIDQFVQAPIFTVLIFGFLGFLEGKNLNSIKQQLDDDYADTMVANWKLWVPATVVNIAFVPPILRVLYLNCIFFFWSIFLSIKINGSNVSNEEN